MIAKRIEFGGMKFLAAGNFEAVLVNFDRQTHSLEIFGDGSDPICFLHTQLARIAHHQALVAGRPENRQYGYLIDQRRSPVFFDQPSANIRFPHLDVADQLAAGGRKVQHLDLRAHFRKQIEQCSPRGIQSNGMDGQIGFADDKRSGQKESSGG